MTRVGEMTWGSSLLLQSQAGDTESKSVPAAVVFLRVKVVEKHHFRDLVKIATERKL
jgi:hypothetical protein